MSEQHVTAVNGAGAMSGAGEQHSADGEGPGHGQELVDVTVNNNPVKIHRGRQPVSELKRLGGVPAADELAQVVDGQPLKPLADDGSLVIKGGEEFVSYPKDSSSSFVAPVE